MSWVKKVKGLGSTHWQLENHEEIKYSLGNVVNNVMTMHGEMWVKDLLGDQFISDINVYQCYHYAAYLRLNIIVYVNCNKFVFNF